MSTRARPYAAGDREACLAVFDSNVPRFFRTSERREFEDFLGRLPGPYVVLEDPPGTIVGCGGHAVDPADGTADLCWGMVRADLHGRGLGRLLTRLRINAAAADPAVRLIRLHTSQHTAGFYEREGFRVLRTTHDGYAPGLDRVDMARAVRSPARS